jgi:hypothetical protein
LRHDRDGALGVGGDTGNPEGDLQRQPRDDKVDDPVADQPDPAQDINGRAGGFGSTPDHAPAQPGQLKQRHADAVPLSVPGDARGTRQTDHTPLRPCPG